MKKLSLILITGVILPTFFFCNKEADAQSLYPWLERSAEDTLQSRYSPPVGFNRDTEASYGFGSWLSGLPLIKGRPQVLLFNGEFKNNQSAHDAIIDIDVGERNLQQCADAVIRLRAEYLRAMGRENEISFQFTNGSPAKWSDWKRGYRPTFIDKQTVWNLNARPAQNYAAFRNYLYKVFQYAGTASLSKELITVTPNSAIKPGNVFIQGGSPGHAVIVLSTASDKTGNQVFLIAQSYMPAQQVHVLKNPNEPEISPWYRYRPNETLVTPEWNFQQGSLKRFK